MSEGPKGFAGFDSLVSDLSDLPGPPPAPAEAQKAPIVDDDRAMPPPKPPKEETSARKPVIIVLIIFGVLTALGMAASYTDTPLPARQAALESAPATPRSASAPAPAPIATAVPTPARPVVPAEEKPPVGKDTALTEPQLRHCLSQRIRINGAEKAVIRSAQQQIDRFNAMVGDYNGRCGKVRYWANMFQPVRDEVETRRAALETEGAMGFGEWLTNYAPVEPPSAVPTLPATKDAKGFGDKGDKAKPMVAPPSVAPTLPAAQGAKGFGDKAKLKPAAALSPAVAPALPAMPLAQPPAPKRSTSRVPDNSERDYAGQRTCKRGFRQVGGECSPVRMPDNAELDDTGHDWVCSQGFRRVGNGCLR